MSDCKEPLPKKLRTDDGVGVDERGRGEEGGPSSHFSATKEGDVGISEFVSDHQGFFAVLKRRYSDFLVHELSEDGRVVKFTSQSLPFEDVQEEEDADEANLVQLLGEDTAASIKGLFEGSDKEKEVRVMASLDKGQRTLLHKTVRALYPLLESETLETEAGKSVVIRHAPPKKKSGVGSRSSWPRERGSHCRFVLYKENIDTMDAVNVISRLLKIKSSCFHFAGTKDKRAITSQLLTAFKVSAEKLQTLNAKLRNMQLGNFKYVSNPLKLGSLSGNKFTVILRNVSCEDHVISKAVKNLGEAGFINYYGMQRFGTSSIPTYEVGRCLVHSDWKGAIDVILKPRPGEPEEMSSAREYYQTSGGDASGTLSRWPKKRYVERQLLQGLEKHASLNNYLGALNFIPRNNRLIYVHSWQSYCWNQLASWRLRELGPSPVPGDLVVKSSIEKASAHKPELVTPDNKSEYSIRDVVLPLPGYNIQLPANGVKEEYAKVLAKEEVTMEGLKNSVRDMSLTGSYRHIVIIPKDINWEVIHYDDLTIPLVQTDLDIFSGRQPPASEGSLKAVKVEFSLPSACYATMAIRELIKMETSPAYQTTLNDVESHEPS